MDVGQTLAAGVVKLGGQLGVGEGVACGGEEVGDLHGWAIPVVSPNATSSAPASINVRAMPRTRSVATAPS